MAGSANCEQFYKLLSHHGIDFPPHVLNILTKVGYTCVQSLAHLEEEDLSEIETTVKAFPKDGMSEEECVNLFGHAHAKDPSKFKFFVGEKSSLRAAVKLCKKFVRDGQLKPGYLNVARVSTKRHQPSPHLPRQRIRTELSSDNENTATEAVQPVPIKPVRSLREQYLQWAAHSKVKFDLTPEECEFDEDVLRIYCKKCEPSFSSKVTITSSNTYSVTNFSKHVTTVHRRRQINEAVIEQQGLPILPSNSGGLTAPVGPSTSGRVTAVSAGSNAISGTVNSDAGELQLTPSFFERVVMNEKRNWGRVPNGYRHTDDSTNHLAMTSLLLGGAKHFEVLQANSKGGLPSVKTVRRNLAKFDRSIAEGLRNVSLLKEHLNDNSFPPLVVLSTDGTQVIARAGYDPKTNSITGFSQPRQQNGYPAPESAVVKTAVDIYKQFYTLKKATVKIVMMVQPLCDGSSPVRLCSFASDNRYSAEEVTKCLVTAIKEMEDNGISTLVTSADGDSREMKAMRQRLRLGLPLTKQEKADDSLEPVWLKRKYDWWASDFLKSSIPVQDTVHLAAKLRVRFLKVEKLLPLGNFVVSATDFLNLMAIVSKDRHLLREGDLNLLDKMNYNAAARLSSPHLEELLRAHVPGSDGTIFFWKLTRYIVSSFLDKDLKPEERIYRIWFGVFSLRLWRKWIDAHKTYSVVTNFVTLNAYLCTEINAHALILVYLTLTEKSLPHLMLPWLLSSQACESYFKNLRSLTPSGSTIINMDSQDFEERSSKADALVRLTSLGQSDGINYPRHQEFVRDRLGGSEKTAGPTALPAMSDIEAIVLRAQRDSKAELEALGVSVKSKDGLLFDSKLATRLFTEKPRGRPSSNRKRNPDPLLDESDECDQLEVEPDDQNDPDYYFRSEIDFFTSLTRANLKDYSSQVEKLKENAAALGKRFEVENSPYVCVPSSKGDGVCYLKKSAVVWFLDHGVRRLSNDRSVRVAQTASFRVRQQMCVKQIGRKVTLKLGDWGVFAKEHVDLDDIYGNFLIGRVLQMGCLQGSKKEREKPIYEFTFTGDQKNVGVLCLWYSLDTNNEKKLTGKLMETRVLVHGLHPCSTYLCSIPQPNFNCNTREITLSPDDTEILNELMTAELA